VEAAGIEPNVDFDASGILPDCCVICNECRAAQALHSEFFKRHLLASLDADLQAVVVNWHSLPGTIRKAMMALFESI